MGYFDATYFDPTYFDTGSAASAGGGSGRKASQRQINAWRRDLDAWTERQLHDDEASLLLFLEDS